MPVALGFDVHRLVPGRPLRLGGVDIPHDCGLEGHSDADVAIHAVIDALLGAAGLGDIGDRFPDTDPRWKGAAGAALLADVLREIAPRWRVAHVDVTLLLERPRLGPLKARIRENLAKLLGVAEGAVSVKAKSFEGLGPIGEGRGAAAYAIAELVPR